MPLQRPVAGGWADPSAGAAGARNRKPPPPRRPTVEQLDTPLRVRAPKPPPSTRPPPSKTSGEARVLPPPPPAIRGASPAATPRADEQGRPDDSPSEGLGSSPPNDPEGVSGGGGGLAAVRQEGPGALPPPAEGEVEHPGSAGAEGRESAGGEHVGPPRAGPSSNGGHAAFASTSRALGGDAPQPMAGEVRPRYGIKLAPLEDRPLPAPREDTSVDAKASGQPPECGRQAGYGFQLGELTTAEREALQRCEAAVERRSYAWAAYRLEENTFFGRHDAPVQITVQSLKVLCRKGVPPDLRARVWRYTSGADRKKRMAPPGYYSALVEASGRYPFPEGEQIALDVPRTFAKHPHFGGEEGRGALRRVLSATAWHNPAIGYCQGLNFVAALLLLVLPEETAFWMVQAFVEDIMFPGVWGKDLMGAKVEAAVLDKLLQAKFPKLSKHLAALGLPAEAYAVEWLVSLFAGVLPADAVARVWDAMLLEGNKIFFRVALSILRLHRRALMSCKDAGDALGMLKRGTRRLHDRDTLMRTGFKKLGSMPGARIHNIRERHALYAEASRHRPVSMQHMLENVGRKGEAPGGIEGIGSGSGRVRGPGDALDPGGGESSGSDYSGSDWESSGEDGEDGEGAADPTSKGGHGGGEGGGKRRRRRPGYAGAEERRNRRRRIAGKELRPAAPRAAPLPVLTFEEIRAKREAASADAARAATEEAEAQRAEKQRQRAEEDARVREQEWYREDAAKGGTYSHLEELRRKAQALGGRPAGPPKSKEAEADAAVTASPRGPSEAEPEGAAAADEGRGEDASIWGPLAPPPSQHLNIGSRASTARSLDQGSEVAASAPPDSTAARAMDVFQCDNESDGAAPGGGGVDFILSEEEAAREMAASAGAGEDEGWLGVDDLGEREESTKPSFAPPVPAAGDGDSFSDASEGSLAGFVARQLEEDAGDEGSARVQEGAGLPEPQALSDGEAEEVESDDDVGAGPRDRKAAPGVEQRTRLGAGAQGGGREDGAATRGGEREQEQEQEPVLDPASAEAQMLMRQQLAALGAAPGAAPMSSHKPPPSMRYTPPASHTTAAGGRYTPPASHTTAAGGRYTPPASHTTAAGGSAVASPAVSPAVEAAPPLSALERLAQLKQQAVDISKGGTSSAGRMPGESTAPAKDPAGPAAAPSPEGGADVGTGESPPLDEWASSEGEALGWSEGEGWASSGGEGLGNSGSEGDDDGGGGGKKQRYRQHRRASRMDYPPRSPSAPKNFNAPRIGERDGRITRPKSLNDPDLNPHESDSDEFEDAVEAAISGARGGLGSLGRRPASSSRAGHSALDNGLGRSPSRDAVTTSPYGGARRHVAGGARPASAGRVQRPLAGPGSPSRGGAGSPKRVRPASAGRKSPSKRSPGKGKSHKSGGADHDLLRASAGANIARNAW